MRGGDGDQPLATGSRSRKRAVSLNVRRADVWLVLAGTALGLVLCEVGLRVISDPSPNFYRSDIDTGFALREGAEGWWRSEGESYVRISSDGLRDREHSK